MKTKLLKLTVLVAAFVIPTLAFAASGASNMTLADLVGEFIYYFKVAITFIISLAIVTFIYNIYKYFIKSDPESKKEAGMYVLYSVLGFVIILGMWGIVAVVNNSLNLPKSSPMWPFTSIGTGGSSQQSSQSTMNNGFNTTPTMNSGAGNQPPMNSGFNVQPLINNSQGSQPTMNSGGRP